MWPIDDLNVEEWFGSAYDLWQDAWLSTTPADRPAAEAACRLAYQEVGRGAPPLLFWLRSPLAGC
jgi:hypothetical protein